MCRWEILKSQFTKGIHFELEDLTDELRKLDVIESTKRGNHKLSKLKSEFVGNVLEKEIWKYWILLLPTDCYLEIPDLVLNPIGVATHLGITDKGEFKPKDRLTHKLSFPGTVSMQSINLRVKKQNLEPCIFSFVLSRVIHYIVALHTEYPTKRIWRRKEDINQPSEDYIWMDRYHQ